MNEEISDPIVEISSHSNKILLCSHIAIQITNQSIKNIDKQSSVRQNSIPRERRPLALERASSTSAPSSSWSAFFLDLLTSSTLPVRAQTPTPSYPKPSPSIGSETPNRRSCWIYPTSVVDDIVELYIN